MNICTDKSPEQAKQARRREWLWFGALWCIGPICMAVLDGVVRVLTGFLR